MLRQRGRCMVACRAKGSTPATLASAHDCERPFRSAQRTWSSSDPGVLDDAFGRVPLPWKAGVASGVVRSSERQASSIGAVSRTNGANVAVGLAVCATAAEVVIVSGGRGRRRRSDGVSVAPRRIYDEDRRGVESLAKSLCRCVWMRPVQAVMSVWRSATHASLTSLSTESMAVVAPCVHPFVALADEDGVGDRLGGLFWPIRDLIRVRVASRETRSSACAWIICSRVPRSGCSSRTWRAGS